MEYGHGASWSQWLSDDKYKIIGIKMTNSKPIIDNSRRVSSKKKKQPIDIHLDELKSIRIDDTDLSGKDIAAHADALAGAKIAQQAIGSAIEEAEVVLRAAMMKQYCDHYLSTGSQPDIRRGIGKLCSFNVVQQQNARLTPQKIEELSSINFECDHYQKSAYSINLSKLPAETVEKILASVMEIAGDDFHKIVSETVVLGREFFNNLIDLARSSLRPGERLDEKLLHVMRIINPTIQFKDFGSDLHPAYGFELAYEFSQISANKQKALESAEKSVAGIDG